MKKSTVTTWEQKFSGYAKTGGILTEWEAELAGCNTAYVYVLAGSLDHATKIIAEHTKAKIVALKNTGKVIWQEEKK